MTIRTVPDAAWGVVPRAQLIASAHLLSWHLLMGAVTGRGPAYSRNVTTRAAELRSGAALNTKDAVVIAMGEFRPPAQEAVA